MQMNSQELPDFNSTGFQGRDIWQKTGLARWRKERRLVALLLLLLIGLLFVEAYLFRQAENFADWGKWVFLGLTHFNVFLILFLLFFVFRHFIKAISERRKGFVGQLRWKLVLAFGVFAFLPSSFIFVVQFVYLKASWERWTQAQWIDLIKETQKLYQSLILNAKRRLINQTVRWQQEFQKKSDQKAVTIQLGKKQLQILQQIGQDISVDGIEIRSWQTWKPIYRMWKSLKVPDESALVQFLEDNFDSRQDAWMVRSYSYSDGKSLVMQAIAGLGPVGVLVVYQVWDGVGRSPELLYDRFNSWFMLLEPTEQLHIFGLIIVTLVIAAASMWLAFYLARLMSYPFVLLSAATTNVLKGRYETIAVSKWPYSEVLPFIQSFNSMIVKIQTLLKRLDQEIEFKNNILSRIQAGVIVVNRKGQIRHVNPAAASYVGVSLENLLKGRSYWPRHWLKAAIELLKELKQVSEGYLSRQVPLKINHELRLFHVHVHQFKIEDPPEWVIIWVFDDVTNLMQAQRWQTWAQVARRVAHEIKNPLTPIRLTAEYLLERYRNIVQDERFEQRCQMIMERVDHLNRIIRDFLQLARWPDLRLSLVHIHEILQKVAHWFQTSYPSVKFYWDLAPQGPAIWLDPDQIQQVFQNLFQNSIQGRENQENVEIYIKTQWLPMTHWWRIWISDNGPGIAPEMASRIFDLGVSGHGKGFGLGLAIVKKIIQDHGGHIHLVDSHQTGATFLIELPAHKDLTKLSQLS